MALWYDWGGHPLVLQQIGVLLRDRRAGDAATLANLAHSGLNLGGPRYGVSLAGESGLGRSERAALARIAAGQPPGDEHAAATLQDHGAIVRRKSGWAVENCVLRRHLTGTVEASIGTDPPARTASKAAPQDRVFTWIHLSDLHFGPHSRFAGEDLTRLGKAFQRDLDGAKKHFEMKGKVDLAIVTGDLAESGKPKEFDMAAQFLTALAGA